MATSSINYTQLQTTLAPVVAAGAGFLAGKGYFGWDAQTWIGILGGLGTVVATIWGAVAARKSAMVSTVAAMPEVSSVTLNGANPGTASLNDSTPNNVVVK